MKIDRKKRLKFASLQGETAKAQLDDDQRSDLKSMVFFSYNRPITQQSSAVINALMAVGGFWKIVVVFKIIPTFIRDSIYQWIAKHRYRWFGIKDSCRMPVEADQGRILP